MDSGLCRRGHSLYWHRNIRIQPEPQHAHGIFRCVCHIKIRDRHLSAHHLSSGLFYAQKYTLLLFYASVVFSASLLADRTLPLYEPVYGARFIEIGGAAIMLALFCVLCGNLAEAYRHSLTMAEEHRQMERQLAMQKDHYRQLTDQIGAARTASHDLRHHMRALREWRIRIPG